MENKQLGRYTIPQEAGQTNLLERQRTEQQNFPLHRQPIPSEGRFHGTLLHSNTQQEAKPEISEDTQKSLDEQPQLNFLFLPITQVVMSL